MSRRRTAEKEIKIPLRLCIGCQEMKPKKELVRMIKTDEGEIVFDFTGKMRGRGAYLCKNEECLKRARKGHRLERSFACRVSDETYEVMAREMQKFLDRSSDDVPQGENVDRRSGKDASIA